MFFCMMDSLPLNLHSVCLLSFLFFRGRRAVGRHSPKTARSAQLINIEYEILIFYEFELGVGLCLGNPYPKLEKKNFIFSIIEMCESGRNRTVTRVGGHGFPHFEGAGGGKFTISKMLQKHAQLCVRFL